MEGAPRFPLGRGREGPWLPQVTLGPSRDEAELSALISALLLFFFFFFYQHQDLPSQHLQLALTTFSLFDLLNVCFSSVFHTHSDSLPSPLPDPGTSARQ